MKNATYESGLAAVFGIEPAAPSSPAPKPSAPLFPPREEGAGSGIRSAILGTVFVAGEAISVYHGYKRNNGSIGWAIGWGVLAMFFPVITPAIALAQGLGKPAK